MAFEADCVVSTVLKEIRVTGTVGFLVPAEFREGRMPHSSRRATVVWRPS